MTKLAIVYRMVTEDHICPFGLKSVDLLKRKGFEVQDQHLKTREQTDQFKDKWGVKTTPQTFLGEETEHARIGGFDDLREHFGIESKDPNATTYTPVFGRVHNGRPYVSRRHVGVEPRACVFSLG